MTYHGRIGHIDLTTRRVTYKGLDPTTARRYGGGGTLAAALLLQEVPPRADPLGPENVVVLASSILAGAPAPGLSKHLLAAKSPLTGGAGEATSVSPFGTAFATAGLDALVIRGASSTPVVLAVGGGTVELRDAEDLWGLEVADAHDRLVTGHPYASTALIGPAGERLVRFASVVNDCRFMSCRSGIGAVFGAKRVKGVMALPGSQAPFGDPRAAREAIDDYRSNRLGNPINAAQERTGVGSWLADTPEVAGMAVCTRNFQQASFDGLAGVGGEVLTSRHRLEGPTPAWIDYAHRYGVSAGPLATDPRYGGLETNTIAALGPLVGVDDLAAVLGAAERTYRYGLDPESLGGTIAWAMECTQRGLTGIAAAGGRDVAFGDAVGLLELIDDIAHRRGAGALLGEGSARAAEVTARGSERWLMTVKGKELPPHEPRSKPGLALGYGIGPTGPEFAVVEHDLDYDPNGFEWIIDSSRAFGLLERTPETDLGPAKVRQIVAVQRFWSGALESLLFDLFTTAPARYMPPLRMEQLARGITGWDLSLHEIVRMGMRRIVLLQTFNRREGLSLADDVLPRRCYEEPLPDSAYRGEVIDRDAYDTAVGLAHSMHGLDADGVPRPATLHDLDLDWAVAQLLQSMAPSVVGHAETPSTRDPEEIR